MIQLTDSKKVYILCSALALVAVLVAAWAGGRQRWDVLRAEPITNGSDALLSAYEKKLEETPADLDLKYNLACLYYEQDRFSDAEALFEEILESPHLRKHLEAKAAYNLGNALYRQSESLESQEAALDLLQQSLLRYRTVLAQEEGLSPEFADDVRFNFTLVKQRIKVLADQIRQHQKEQARRQALIVQLKTLLAREKELQSELQALMSMEKTAQQRQRRDSLLKRQAGNLERLQIVREKIMALMKSSPAPAASTAPPAI